MRGGALTANFYFFEPLWLILFCPVAVRLRA